MLRHNQSAWSHAGCRSVLLSTLIYGFIAILVAGCDEQILHNLSEQDANKVLSRLSTRNLGAKKVVQPDGRWAISVSQDTIVPALAYLDENRVLAPRAADSVPSSKNSFVPSREEQWFRYERSVSLSIEDSLSTMQGILEARVHLNLPETDPLFGTRKENDGSGSVLLVVDDRYSSKDADISAMVGGAAGIPPQSVTILRSHLVNEAVIEPSKQAVTKNDSAEINQENGGNSSKIATEFSQPGSPPESEAKSSGAVTKPALFAALGARYLILSGALVALFGLVAVGKRNRNKRVKFSLPVGVGIGK